MGINFIFLGSFFPKEEESSIEKKSLRHTQTAANVLQWKLIEGLTKNCDNKYKFCTGISVGSYPQKYKDFLIKSADYSYKEKNDVRKIGFINLSILKQIAYHKSYISEIKRTFKRNQYEVAIAYSCGLIKELCYAKKRNPNMKCILIVPDLLEYTSLDISNSILRYYKAKEQKQFIKAIKSGEIDGFIVLTSFMAEKLCLPRGRYEVLEGISEQYNPNCFIYHRQNSPNSPKTILYTGSLAIKYGILDLIEEFKMLEGDYRLVICGGGNENEIVESNVKGDSRIAFRGLVSHAEALQLQREADILVNPRKNSEEYTKYSFPSKLLEYLITGRPVVCYKLDGIPDEYSNVLFYASSHKGGLAKKLKEVAEMSESDYLNYSERAMDLLKKKTAERQCKKIYDLLEKI